MESKTFELKMPKKAEKFAKKVIKIASIGEKGKPVTLEASFNCNHDSDYHETRDKYIELVSEIEREKEIYREADIFTKKFLLGEATEEKKSSKSKKNKKTKLTPTIRLKEIMAELEVKKKEALEVKKTLKPSNCDHWAFTDYEIWDEKKLIYERGEEYPYHTLNGEKYYLGPDGYFLLKTSCYSEECDLPLSENSVPWSETVSLFDENLQGYYHTYKGKRYFLGEDGNYYPENVIKTDKITFPLGFGSYCRGPNYEKLHFCDWHGGLIPEDRLELIREMDLEGNDSPVMKYANPMEKRSVIKLVEENGALVRKSVDVSFPKLGEPPSCGVYVYIKYGNKIDVICYDNCRNKYSNDLLLEEGTTDEKISKMRKFVSGIEPSWKDTDGTVKVFNSYMKEANHNRIRLEELNKKTTGIDDDSRKKLVQRAEEVMNKADKEYKESLRKAEQNWTRKVAKVKEDIYNKSKSGTVQSNVFDYEYLNKLPFPSDDDPIIEKRFYNAAMDYLDYYDDIQEGVVDPSLLKKYMLAILEIDKQRAKAMVQPSDDSLSKILETEFDSESGNELETEIVKLIAEYNYEKRDEVKAKLEKEIKALYYELEEELAEDREFQESLNNVLIVKKENDNDISQNAKSRYIAMMCQTEKTFLDKAEADYNLKEKTFKKDSEELASNFEEKTSRILQEKRYQESEYNSIVRAYFSCRWFLEQCTEFDSVKTMKDFSLNEEEPPEDESVGQEKFRLEEERKLLDKVVKKVTEKSNNIRNSMKKIENLLVKFERTKIEQDYEEFKNNQLLAMRSSRQERGQNAGVKVVASKSMVTMQTLKVPVREQIGEDKKVTRIAIAYQKETPKIPSHEIPLNKEGSKGPDYLASYRAEVIRKLPNILEMKAKMPSPKTPGSSKPSTPVTVVPSSPAIQVPPSEKKQLIRVPPVMRLNPIPKAPPIKTSPTVVNVEVEKSSTTPTTTPILSQVISPPRRRANIALKLS